MWIKRKGKRDAFNKALMSLRSQVLVVRGARQAGKTSFVINALKNLGDYPQILINCASKGRSNVDGVEYYGRDFLGDAEDASQLLHNISLISGELNKRDRPVIVFIDEADRYPVSLEMVQAVAGRSDTLKVVYTGSNLENVQAKNAATGRKRYFDLYPITFQDFLNAYNREAELKYLNQISLKDSTFSTMYHDELNTLFDLYLRLGGMPRILDAFIEGKGRAQPIPQIVSDLANTIEENVKIVLGEKAQLYEYEDVLRKLALLSMDTLKFSKLQVQHAGKREAKKLVNKTVGARVAHKIRLYDSGADLSKYIIFDSGILNYLLSGSNLLNNRITRDHMAIHYETVVGCEFIASISSRDDLFYWKSRRGAQVEYIIKSPSFLAVDVKSLRGDVRSLDSCAVFEGELEYVVKVSKQLPSHDENHIAKIPSLGLSRKIPLVTIPHYLSSRLFDLVS